jgi:hypothetical protein
MALFVAEDFGIIGIIYKQRTYVCVPGGHPSYGLNEYDEGITYGNLATKFKEYVFPPGYWIFGWDCNYFESTPTILRQELDKIIAKKLNEELVSTMKKLVVDLEEITSSEELD